MININQTIDRYMITLGDEDCGIESIWKSTILYC
jgi:hypothetical protein